MLVLGIDPGSMKTGIASVNSAGKCRFKTLWADNHIPWRYGTFRNELADFLVELEEDPVAVAIEQPEELPLPGSNEKEIRSIVRLNCICAVIISEVTRLWPNINILPWPPRIWRKQKRRRPMSPTGWRSSTASISRRMTTRIPWALRITR